MKFKGSGRHAVDVLAVLLVLFLFTACALSVVLLGVNVYRKTAASMETNFTTRTCLSYIVEKIRQNDLDGGVSVTDQGGIMAVTLKRTYSGDAYTTYIYEDNHTLRELFIRSDATFSAPDGQAIMEIGSFDATESDGVIHLTVSDSSGCTESVAVAERSGK